MSWLSRILTGWLVVTLLGALILGWVARISDSEPPDAEAQRWAFEILEATRLGERASAIPIPSSAESYRCPGPVIVEVWDKGRRVAVTVKEGLFSEVIVSAAAELRRGDAARADGWSVPASGADRVRFTISLVQGESPLVLGIPFLSELSLVPLRDGLVVRHAGQEMWFSPEFLRSENQYDRATPVPIPDLSFGIDVEGLVDRAARDLGVDFDDVYEDGEYRRFRTIMLAETEYPSSESVTEHTLRAAAVEGAEFLLLHQDLLGRYTYVYDAGQDQARAHGYNLPRHSGTTYFLAQVARLAEMPEAREGALRALQWIERHHLRSCGGDNAGCIVEYGLANVGSAALTAVAAAEVLAAGEDAQTRMLLGRLMAFLRGQQRPDGELMHEFDVTRQEPIDVQHMYYSGEAALAFFRSHRVTGDERDLEAGRRLMGHLTGAAWDFFGSRYFYGEEHWTCIAAGEAYDRVPMPEALDFCLRWAEWNDAIQFQEGETPWETRGMYGVGPLIVPRLTPVGSRSEAFISTYEMMLLAGEDHPRIRRMVESGLSALLRWRWNPGPIHLFRSPARARGGIPGSPVDLSSRNDFVQHGGSAIIRWASILGQEASE
jgi:hypothetical protein